MGWMSRKWGWAKQKPFFWWSLLLAGVTLVLMFVSPGPILFTGPSDLRLRLWGLGLQLIGVATVWSDLTSTARKFGRDGIIRAIVDWLKAFLAQRRVIEVPIAEMMVAADTVRAKVRRPIVSTAPLPDRVTAVEINIQKIDQDLDTVHKEIDAAIDDVKARISVEATTRDRALRDIRASVEDTSAGNFATLAFGVVWLAIGIVLATLAPEIAKVVAGHWHEVWTAF